MVDFAAKLRELRDRKASEESTPVIDPVSEMKTEDGTVEQGHHERWDTPCFFVTGRAGTGKTYMMKQRIKADASYGVLAATTGIAAVNLDAITINSLLGYFDTDSMRDAYLSGTLVRKLHDLALEYSSLIVDENSMMDRVQLEILRRAIDRANDYADIRRPMGLILVGDFAQLPPVKGDWSFEADCWAQDFAPHVERLTKVWRQSDGPFLEALNAARAGRGLEATYHLTRQGIRWETMRIDDFDGTTILAKNDAVDRHNEVCLMRLPRQRFFVQSRRWGKQRAEWKNIPQRAEFKVGAYVMILANAQMEDKDAPLTYANGDCGHIVNWNGYSFEVELVRNGETVAIEPIVRSITTKDKPNGWTSMERGEGEYLPRLHQDHRKRYVLGQVEYYPLRLAYASTVHKSQGLTLDRAQIDFRDHFFGHPAMLYVALSRCRTLEGLRLVGQPDRFVMQCKCDPKVVEWL